MGPTISRKAQVVVALVLGMLFVYSIMSTKTASPLSDGRGGHRLLKVGKLNASSVSLSVTSQGPSSSITAIEQKTILTVKAPKVMMEVTTNQTVPNKMTTPAVITFHPRTLHTTTKEAKYNAAESLRIRAAEIKQRCQRADKGRLPMVKGNQYLVTLMNKNYAYYPIAKCGWTTWTHILFSAAGKADEPNQKGFEIGWMSPFEHVGMKKEKLPFLQLQQYKERMLFVRDPYDRLVSAYKNKILYGTYNVNFGVPCSWLKRGMPPPTFPQFVQCILAKSNNAAKMYRVPLSSKEVARVLDIHWTPQYWTSLPCDSKYTLVGRFEHLNEDIMAAMDIIKLKTSVPHENSSKNASLPLSHWYNQLPEEDRRSLKELYKYDFEIFGFNSTVPS